MRVHGDLLPDVLVRHTGLPRPRVMQVIRQAKAAGRIAAGRPYAPPLTARDVARLIMALSASSPGTAVAHERVTGRLPKSEGVGEATPEAAIVTLISKSMAGHSPPAGQIAIAQNRPFVEVRRAAGSETYGAIDDAGFSTFVLVPLATICAIAHQLLD